MALSAARLSLTRTIATLTRARRPQLPVTLTPEGAVTISYPNLVSSPLDLQHSIEQAFGSDPKSLGIVIIRDLPSEYVALRERLLKLANKFASLDEETRERYADSKSRYSFGWSHGKEIMNGRPGEPRLLEIYVDPKSTLSIDTLKGSYYANPLIDSATVSQEQRAAHPEYYGNNIWPAKEEKGVEGFEEAFKDLGKFVFQVGCKLAAACQPFASSHLADRSLSLPDLISTSQTTKARLLHYFPPSPEHQLPAEDEPIDSWCGFHLDHSLLTGLCSAMYLSHDGPGEPMVVQSPSPSSGLYIRARGGALTKVSIPTDCLAFQTGEALELATNGKLRATPHCVRVGAGQGADEISRETFALFMQPDTHQQVGAKETFGQFSERVFSEHYEASKM